MGQLVGVIEKPSSIPGVVRFELNRNLTGMGHERFVSLRDAIGPSPAAEVARRLLSTGQVGGVHVYGNIITVDLEKGFSGNGLAEIVRDLYQYWKPGMKPPSLEELAPPAAEESSSAPSSSGESSGLQRTSVSEFRQSCSNAAVRRWRNGRQLTER